MNVKQLRDVLERYAELHKDAVRADALRAFAASLPPSSTETVRSLVKKIDEHRRRLGMAANVK